MITKAEEFLQNTVGENNNSFDIIFDVKITSDVTKAMIEFAKLHVEAALKAASEKVKCGLEYSHHEGEFEDIPVYEATVDEKSILNAYPESNIK